MQLVPENIFLTKGIGHHQKKLISFELALRSAGIETCNLISVSSILPPGCQVIPRNEGIKLLRPGQITFAVIARESTNEPNRLIAASVGLAQPVDPNDYGYISEHHGFGETEEQASEFAEDLAADMLASAHGLDIDITTGKVRNQYEHSYIIDENTIFKTRYITQTEKGHEDGLWTTVVAAAVML
uniref:Pyruvoyl-dependent arginine decarboxylase AaxB n=1 Tax=Candidatus Kentrum sp. FW TaxID=2126338 RepID=A0A450TH83_9GAMM|nr:MAG: arginine decarboxylase [Candidatus Kentron sp. FW]